MRKISLNLFLFSVYSLLAGAQPSGQPWNRYTIDASSTGADGVKMADLNGDGLSDITTGWEEGGITKVYLHPGKALVKKEWPAVTLGSTPSVEDAVFADMDTDGQWEVVSCTEGKTKRIFVHFISGNDPLQPEAWRQQQLPAADTLMQWMYAASMQLDGRRGEDLIAGGKGKSAAIGWFEAPRKAGQLDQWRWHPISDIGWLMGLFLRDMDADGDQDLVITDRYGEQQGCRWLENPGSRRKQKQAWASHLIGGGGLEVMFMDMTDLDGDGQEEVLLSERTEESIRCYKSKDQTGKSWEEATIALPPFTGRAKSVAAGDLNADGIPDLVISTNTYGGGKHGLIWLDGRKLEAPKPADFSTISGAHNAKYDKVELLDIDLDGDLDVLICEENYGTDSQGLGVVWYENTVTRE